MALFIKRIQNLHLVAFDKGVFDDWCVYLTRDKMARYAPRDVEYFSILKEIGHRHGHATIYDDFIKIYRQTGAFIDNQVLDLITRLSAAYGQDAEEMNIWLTVIYAGMVAEENKEKTILRKRIKRLGMHQLLIEGATPEYAAGFSKGKNWRDLDQIMRERGF